MTESAIQKLLGEASRALDDQQYAAAEKTTAQGNPPQPNSPNTS